MERGNLPPGANITDVDAGLGKAVPDLPKVSGTDLALPSGKDLNTDLPFNTDIKLPDNPGDKVNVAKADLPTVDVPKPDVPDVGNVTDKATGYAKDVKQVKEGDLSKVDDVGQEARFESCR